MFALTRFSWLDRPLRLGRRNHLHPKLQASNSNLPISINFFAPWPHAHDSVDNTFLATGSKCGQSDSDCLLLQRHQLHVFCLLLHTIASEKFFYSDVTRQVAGQTAAVPTSLVTTLCQCPNSCCQVSGRPRNHSEGGWLTIHSSACPWHRWRMGLVYWLPVSSILHESIYWKARSYRHPCHRSLRP